MLALHKRKKKTATHGLAHSVSYCEIWRSVILNASRKEGLDDNRTFDVIDQDIAKDFNTGQTLEKEKTTKHLHR